MQLGRNVPMFFFFWGGGVSVSSRLHGVTFQKTDVRGLPPRGTSSRKSFFKFSLLIVALYRAVILSEQHRMSFSAVIPTHVWGRRLHGYGLYDEQAGKNWQTILVR